MTNFEWLAPLNTLPFKLYALAENAISVEFGQEISDVTFNRIQNMNTAIQQHPFEGYQGTVPAYASLTIFFNPMQVMANAQLSGINCFERLSNYLLQLDRKSGEQDAVKNQPTTIPVCYAAKFAPDLAFLMNYYGLTKQEIIDIHSAAMYKVHMVGFIPGFAYLGGLPTELSAPRKSVPRSKVSAGSVGIAGTQTGIYPLESPGGWQIIGRTPLKLFDVQRSQKPFLLKAGDKVVFTAIDTHDFESLQRDQHAHQNH